MTYTKKYKFLLILLILPLVSCSKFSKWFAKRDDSTIIRPPQAEIVPSWSVETYYVIHDISPAIGDRIMSSIATKVLANPKAIRRLGHEEIITVTGYQDGYGFAIHPSEVTALSKLSRIQQVITEISEQEVVPVQLVSNILHFQSVSGDAAAYTEIYGEASPGSIVDIDDGSGRMVSVLTADNGTWEARIRQNDRLRDRKGYVYIRISKGAAIQFIEMDVLSKKKRRVNHSELPANSVLIED